MTYAKDQSFKVPSLNVKRQQAKRLGGGRYSCAGFMKTKSIERNGKEARLLFEDKHMNMWLHLPSRSLEGDARIHVHRQPMATKHSVGCARMQKGGSKVVGRLLSDV